MAHAKKLSKKMLSAFLALLLVFSCFSVCVAFAGTAKVTTYSLEDILAVTSLPVININMENGEDVERDNKDLKKNIAEFIVDENHDGTNEVDILYADNPMTIKGRGYSSWNMSSNKKSYNIKFDSKVNLLGLGKNKSYSLVSSWVDTSYLRNYIAYKTGALLNTSAMDCEMVELCVNGTYEGIYLLTEKYGLGDTRVATAGDGYDVNGDGEVSSFLIEADSRAVTNDEPNRFTVSYDSSTLNFVVKDPDEEELSDTSTQFTQLVTDMQTASNAIESHTGYEDYIDIDSFIDTYIINELYKNPDFGYGTANQPCCASTFCYKEEGGKLYFGTIWDFDIAMGRNDLKDVAAEGNRDTAGATGFLFNQGSWISSLMQDDYFVQRLKERWTQVREVLADYMTNDLPTIISAVAPTVDYDINTWGAVSTRTTSYIYRTPLAYADECAYIQSFINDRMDWLDTQWQLDTKVEEIDTSYWSRANNVTGSTYADIKGVAANYAHKDLVGAKASAAILELYNESDSTAVKGMENVFDGGNGQQEVGGTDVNKIGTKSVLASEDGVALASPITIEGYTTGCNVYSWYPAGSIPSSGFGGSTKSYTISTSGTYYFLATGGWWFSSGTAYTMGTSNNYLYEVVVAPNGGVTVYDCALSSSAEASRTSTNYAVLSGSGTSFTLGYSSTQAGNTGTAVGGTAVTQSISISAETYDLTVTERPSTSTYAGTPAAADAVYVNFEGANPASWSVKIHGTTQDATSIATFDTSKMLLTAVGAGSVDVVAYTSDGTVSNTLTFNVTVNADTALVTEANKVMGIYAPSVVGSRDEQDNWATVANGTTTRFTSYFTLTPTELASADSFFLASEDRDSVIGGKADYYIYVNGTPYIKATYGSDSAVTSDTFTNNYTIAANGSDFSSYERYKCCETYMEDISCTGLKSLLNSGANRIDVIVKADADTAVIRPYLYANMGETVEVIVNVTDVELSAHTVDLTIDSTYKLTATITPSDASNQNVTWTSSDDTVAKVSSKGKITGLSAGTATITVTTEDGGFTDTCEVTVSAPDITVSINDDAESISVCQYATSTLTAAISPSVSDETVTWTSADATIASVDANGVVTGNKIGTTTITATSNFDSTKFDTITVTVTALEYTVSIQSRKDSIGLSEVLTLTPVFSVDIPDKSYTWCIDSGWDKGYISYDVFHPTAAGTVVITVRSNYNPLITATKTITIDDSYHALMNIAATNSIVNITAGETATLGVTYTPSNATNKNITWTSVFPDYATVDSNGVVTGVAAGTGIIVASSEDGGRVCVFAIYVSGPAGTITINSGAESVSVTDGDTVTLSAVLANTTYNDVTWTSSDTSVATVDSNGKVTANKVGSVVITAMYAYDNTIKDTITVNITKANVSVSISGDNEVSEGATITLTAAVTPAVSDTSVTWSSSDISVATVSASGVVTGVAAGTATITATSAYDSTKTATKVITVKAAGGSGGGGTYTCADVSGVSGLCYMNSLTLTSGVVSGTYCSYMWLTDIKVYTGQSGSSGTLVGTYTPASWESTGSFNITLSDGGTNAAGYSVVMTTSNASFNLTAYFIPA